MIASMTFLLLETAQPASLSIQSTGSRCNVERLKNKDFLSKIVRQKWVIMKKGRPQLNFLSSRNKRHPAPPRPSDVPSTHCPWRWQYDFDPNREPQYLPKAVCDKCNTQVCKTVHIKFSVVVKSCVAKLLRGKRFYLWERSLVSLPVAFYYRKLLS